jgi:hypothetical protein
MTPSSLPVWKVWNKGPRTRIPLVEHCLHEQSNHNLCFWWMLLALISPDCGPVTNAGREQRPDSGWSVPGKSILNPSAPQPPGRPEHLDGGRRFATK